MPSYLIVVNGRTFIREALPAVVVTGQDGQKALVLKFNPHHDASGRFARGGGGGASRKFDDEGEAKDYCREAHGVWHDSLTADEARVVDLYVGGHGGGAYAKWNAALRSDKPLPKRYQRDTQLMDAALKKATLPEAVTVYRGTRLAALRDNFDNLEGARIKDNAFVSTALWNGNAYPHMGENNVLMEIRLPKGMHAAHVYPRETEILVPRGTSFRVTQTYRQEEFGLRVAVLEPVE